MTVIRFTETADALESENSRIDSQAAQSTQQVTTIENITFSDHGLEGEAAAALEARMHTRTLVAKAFVLALGKIRAANTTNISRLRELRSSGPHGTVDTEKCLETINNLLTEETLNNQTLGAFSQNNTYFDNPPSNQFQAALKTQLETRRKKFNDILVAAQAYITDSATFYTEATASVNNVLTEATNAVNYCVKRHLPAEDAMG